MTDDAAKTRSPDSNGSPQQRHWNRRQRDIANVAWVSFLMAAIASAVFFAMVDPELLDRSTSAGWQISRQAGYAIGFFGFWLLTLATSILSVFLVRTERRRPGRKDQV